MFLKTALDNVLSDGTFTGLAGAQTTPSVYCASLGNSSCEVLNVDLAGFSMDTSSSYGHGVGLLKFCRNGILSFIPLWIAASGATQQTVVWFTDTTGSRREFDSGTLAGAAANPMTATQLCSYLP